MTATYSASTANVIMPRCQHTDGRGQCRAKSSVLVCDYRGIDDRFPPPIAAMWKCDRHNLIKP